MGKNLRFENKFSGALSLINTEIIFSADTHCLMLSWRHHQQQTRVGFPLCSEGSLRTNHKAASLLCSNHWGPFTFHCTICIFIHNNEFIFLKNALLCYDNLMSGELLQQQQLENHSHACMLEWHFCRLDSDLIIFFPIQVENVYSACRDKTRCSVQSRGAT